MININDRSYQTLSEALSAVEGIDPVVIDLNGTILGQQIIDRPNVIIRNGTFVIDFGAYQIMADGNKRGTFRSYTLYVAADNVTLENVRVINEAGYHNGQAIALMIDGDNFRAEKCEFSSYQDTLFLAPLPETEYEKGGFRGPLENKPRIMRRAIFENCLIEGSVDFIFGGGQGYFHGCEIRSRNIQSPVNGYVCAPSTPQGERYGFIFDQCRFTSEPGMRESVYLARPWRDHGKCLIVNSVIGDHIRKEGYSDWDKPWAQKTSEFKEFNNVSRRKPERVGWLKSVSAEDLEQVRNLKENNVLM